MNKSQLVHNVKKKIVIKNNEGKDIFNVNLPFVPIDLNTAHIENIQDSLVSPVMYSKAHKCRFCGHGRLKIQRKSNTILAFEIDAFTCHVAQIKHDGDYNINIDLSKMQTEIIYCDYVYQLKAVVEYKPNHFICHIKRPNGWETYDDLITRVLKTPSSVIASVGFYVKDSKVQTSTSSLAPSPPALSKVSLHCVESDTSKNSLDCSQESIGSDQSNDISSSDKCEINVSTIHSNSIIRNTPDATPEKRATEMYNATLENVNEPTLSGRKASEQSTPKKKSSEIREGTYRYFPRNNRLFDLLKISM